MHIFPQQQPTASVGDVYACLHVLAVCGSTLGSKCVVLKSLLVAGDIKVGPFSALIALQFPDCSAGPLTPAKVTADVVQI